MQGVTGVEARGESGCNRLVGYDEEATLYCDSVVGYEEVTSGALGSVSREKPKPNLNRERRVGEKRIENVRRAREGA